MRATRYLAKLYDMPPEHGEITAFESYASHLYVGTNRGTVLRFHVEGLPEYAQDAPPAAARRDRPVPLTQARDQPESVFTSLLSRVAVSDQRGCVQLLQHSRTQALLFVLCDNRLTVWSTAVAVSVGASASPGADLAFLCEVAGDIGTFFVSPLPPHSATRRPQRRDTARERPDPLHASHREESPSSLSHARQERSSWASQEEERPRSPTHPRTASGNSGISSGAASASLPREDHAYYPYSTATSTTMPGRGGRGGNMSFSAALAAGGQLICAAQRSGKALRVFEFNAFASSTDGGSAVPPRAVRTKEFLLPEPALSLVTVNPETVCVGLRQEYTLLSLATGASRSILRLGTNRWVPAPLIALGDDGEVHMRYHKSIFSAVLKGVGRPVPPLPSTSTPPPRPWPSRATSDDGRAPPAPQAPAASAPGEALPSNFSTFRILGRTVHVENDVELIVSRYPFLFAFTKTYCDVFSAFEDEPVERLPLCGCLYASQLARGETMFVASSATIWMARLHPLRTQLADLVSSVKVDEAFQLLASQRARTGRAFEELTLELHLMAGFTHLHHCHPEKAMRHLGAHVDPRDLVLHVPECIPPSPQTYSTGLQRLLAKGEQHGGCVTFAVSETSTRGGEERTRAGNLTVSHSLEDTDGEGSGSGGYWQGWQGLCPYNTCTTREELLRAWLENFESYLFVPTSQLAGASSLMLRQVPSMGPVSATYFIERCWESLKDALVAHFKAQLARIREVRRSIPLQQPRRVDGSEREGDASSAAERSSAARSPRGAHARRAEADLCERVMSFALLVLALERQDRRAAYRLVSEGNGLCVGDCYDLLVELREFHLLATLLFRRGFVGEACRLIDARLRLAVALGEEGCRQGGGGLARAALPEVIRRKVEGVLLPQSASAKEVDIRRVVYTASGGVPGRTTPAASFLREQSAPRVQLPVSPSFDPASQASCPAWMEAPGDLAELFYLVDTMDLCALKRALESSARLALCRDGDGHTGLHHAFAVLSLLHEAPPIQTETSGPAAAHNALFSQPRTAVVDAALLDLVLAAASLLISFGCPVDAVSFHLRETCLDVAARVCGGAYLDVIVAFVLGAVEVNAVCRAAVDAAAPGSLSDT